MTDEEKKEIIKKMNLGNKYFNKLKFYVCDFLNFMKMLNICIIILILVQLGFVGSLVFFKDCIVIYIICRIILKSYYFVIRKISNSVNKRKKGE